MQVLRLRPSPAQRDSGSAQDDMNNDADSPAAAGSRLALPQMIVWRQGGDTDEQTCSHPIKGGLEPA